MDAINLFYGAHKFLSNFYPAEVYLDGVKFPTVEHAYQAAKSLNPATRELFLHLATAGDAKRHGMTIRIREDWKDAKDGIMLDLLRQKFQIPDLQRKLLDTGDAELIEGNYWHDFYWGVCDGRGLNKLGRLLMQVRNEIVENTLFPGEPDGR